MNSLLIVIFSISLSSSIINPLIGPIIFSESGFFKFMSLDYKMNMYALIVGIYPLGAIIGNPLLGFLSDKINKKKALLIAILGTIIAHNICSMSFLLSMFSLLVVGRFLDGVMSGRRAIALSLLADKHSDMNNVFRKSETANALGLLSGPLLSGLIASQLASMGFAYYALIFALLLVISLINMIFIVNSSTAPMISFPDKVGANKNRVRSYPFFLYFIYFLIQLSFYIYIISLPPLLIVHWSFSPMAVGLTFSILVLSYMLSLVFFHPLINRTFSYRTIIYSALLLGGFFLMLLSVTDMQLHFFLFINFAIVISLSFIIPLIMVKVFEENKDNPGLALGIQNGIIGFAWLLASIMITLLPLAYYMGLFAIAGACLLLTICGLMTSESYLKKR
ncbi:MFS transporter [Tatlockia sp. PL877]|nr:MULTISPECIES: MFS transporter [unclassified Legionella]MDI9818813.1 MFS transporter [Legionella sp. PL877]